MATCFDCKHCSHADGQDGWCHKRQEPMGALDWSVEDFDRYFAHINPKFAEVCEDFEKKKTQVERVWEWIKRG